ncbi:MAG: response regulator transcription factor, partial [Bacteroidales bacterium]|nr:response regulator transcription factor [Bacteroidales bacterium]
MIRILIADDHQLIIDGLQSILVGMEDVSIVATAQNGYQVLERLESGLCPDVILMDINMPGLDGLDCTRQVTRKYPG